LPSLERLKAKMGGKLAVVTISLDTDPAAAVKYLTDNHLTGLDTYADPSLDLSVLLGANELPTTVLIDPAGNVIGRHTGGTEWDSPAAIAALDKIIAKG
jgi:hypothetical protein